MTNFEIMTYLVQHPEFKIIVIGDNDDFTRLQAFEYLALNENRAYCVEPSNNNDEVLLIWIDRVCKIFPFRRVK